MVKCEVIEDFTLEKFYELKNIVRKNVNTDGKLYIGDTFECDKDMADYLMGNNPKNETVVKIVEVEPTIETIKRAIIEADLMAEELYTDRFNIIEKNKENKKSKKQRK